MSNLNYRSTSSIIFANAMSMPGKHELPIQ